MSRDLDQFVARITQVAALYERAPVEAVTRTAKDVVQSVRREIRAVAPSGALSGVRGPRGGAGAGRITVNYEVLADSGRRATAIVSTKGPLQLIESDVKKHQIPANTGSSAGRRTRRRERTGRESNERKFLGNASRDFAAMEPVVHPGTKGQHPFERGVQRVMAHSTPGITAHATVDVGMRRIFGG